MNQNKCYLAATMLAGCLALTPATAMAQRNTGSTGTVGGTDNSGTTTIGAPLSSPESGDVGANVNSTFASGGSTSNASGIAPASVTVPLSPASNSPIPANSSASAPGTVIPGANGTNTSCPDEIIPCAVPPA